jgi:DNA-binding protein YbaB
MTDFTKILDKAKELEAKMKESQEKIREIKAEEFRALIQLKLLLMAKVKCKKLNYLKK